MPQTPSTELLQNPEHSGKEKCVIFEECANAQIPSTLNYNNNVNTGFLSIAPVCHWPNRKSQPKLPKSCWFNNIDFLNDIMQVVEYKFFIINQFKTELMSDYFTIFVLPCFALFSDVWFSRRSLFTMLLIFWRSKRIVYITNERYILIVLHVCLFILLNSMIYVHM